MVASRWLDRRRHAFSAAGVWLLLTLALGAAPTRAQLQSHDPADLHEEAERSAPRVSVVTIGVGDAVHQYFGHNALVVEGATLPKPTVFNYGMFAFGPDMLAQFLKGRLTFWLGLTDLQRTVAQYAAANRDVRLQELNLTPAQRQAVFGRLQRDARPEHRSYLYDHYFDNCSTRVRDVLDGALHGQLRQAWSGPARFTLRQDTMRHTQHDLLTEWGMMFALSASVDRPQSSWNQAFLPLELARLLDYTTFTDAHATRVPLVSGVKVLFRAEREPVATYVDERWRSLLGCGALAALLLVLLGERARRTPRPWRALLLALVSLYGLLGGLLGSWLLYVSIWSDHAVTHGNVNVLLLNPLTLFAGLLTAAELASGVGTTLGHFFQRAADALWFVTCASSVTLLALKLPPVSSEQDISLSASLLIPISLGIALARSRSPDHQHATGAAWATQRS